MEAILLGGVEQWIAVPPEIPGGEEKPLLLWVHGGPGLAETPWLSRFATPLFRKFRPVSWDQRGAGKSWASAEPRSAMTLERLVADAIELSERLAAGSKGRRIVIAGHSFGAWVSSVAARRRPDLYAGIVLAAPLASGVENDRRSWQLVTEAAERAGHARAREQLRRTGPPPWTAADLFAKSLTLMGWAEHFAAAGTGPSRFRSESLAAIDETPEYGPEDRAQFWSAYETTVTLLHGELSGVDLARDVPGLAVPVVAALGRHDLATPPELALTWLDRLDAPSKRIVWFERSGHNPAFEEPQKFAEAAASILDRPWRPEDEREGAEAG